jgi:hypothetical protein
MTRVTTSQSNNITSPDGNSLAVYKRTANGQYIVKDVNGKEEFLTSEPIPLVPSTNGGVSLWIPFSTEFADNVALEIIDFDFSAIESVVNFDAPFFIMATGTIFCTQSASPNDPTKVNSASNYYRCAFNLLARYIGGSWQTQNSQDELSSADEPVDLSFDSSELRIFTETVGFSDVGTNNPKLIITTNISGSQAGNCTAIVNGYAMVNYTAYAIDPLTNSPTATGIQDLPIITVKGS